MRTITKEEAVTLHRKMWNEIADMIKDGVHHAMVMDYKREALDRLGVERGTHDRPLNHCYCCEYSKQNEVTNKVGCIHTCPISWIGKDKETSQWSNTCGHDDSPYSKFTHALSIHNGGQDFTKAEQYAREVANLPERPEV